jgi:8-oxo-dGTP pyrophosphatase MutT (NUDIX family)
MYKVFFKDRIVTLGDDISRPLINQKGLLYRYKNRKELKELILAFNGMQKVRKLHIIHDDISSLVTVFKSCFHCIDAGGGIVRNPKNEFLVIKRNGKWDLPKGKLEVDEDFETAALREVEEETGLKKLEISQFLLSTFHTYGLSGELVLKETRWYEMLYTGNKDPVLQKEEGITDSRWVQPGEETFLEKNTYKSIRKVMKLVGLL